MGNMPTTKQFMFLGREPVIKRTVRQFQKCPDINSIIIVAKEDEIPLYGDIVSEYTKVISVIKGGNSRAESVKNGLKEVPSDADYIAIHDGARCLITPNMISRIAENAFIYGAATAACPATDTVKVISSDGFISYTPDRKTLWNAQTPQIFKTETYRKALYSCSDFSNITDDNSVVEQMGVKVKPVDCTRTNIKITTPEDLFIGEAILKMRGQKY